MHHRRGSIFPGTQVVISALAIVCVTLVAGKMQLAGRPNGWMVVFETADGKRYAATQTYFVTTECWKTIKQFFARRLLREPGRKKLHRGG